MFVAASVGTGVFTQERHIGLRTFLSPTVVAFSVVLAASLIVSIPATNWLVPARLFTSIGTLGMLYSALVWRRMARVGILRSIDLEDRVWYLVVPPCAYGVLAFAGAGFGWSASIAAPTLAAGVALLLLAGIRNAWDMTTWVVLRRPG